jgi:SAM-dependent methyltransferase
VISLDRLDNDLAGWIERVLVAPGVIPASSFEAAFVAIVTSAAPSPVDAWEAFYRNTLRRLATNTGEPGGTISEFAPVHAMASSLVSGTDVVELGCCFGFLSLRLAWEGRTVTALDLEPGTVELLSTIAARLELPVTAVVGDAVRPPMPDRSADTVLAIHLLEHLPPDVGAATLAEMQRIARRRVVVAVPFEETPNPTWGHVRTFDKAALEALGEESGWAFEAFEHHGGWLVLDRP